MSKRILDICIGFITLGVLLAVGLMFFYWIGDIVLSKVSVATKSESKSIKIIIGFVAFGSGTLVFIAFKLLIEIAENVGKAISEMFQ